MRPDVTVLTPTCDQPTGMAFCEAYLARQTFTGRVQWIVADDGLTPATLHREAVHLVRPRTAATGAASLCGNLLAMLPHVVAPIVAIVEHDDWYAPTHLERIVEQLQHPGVLAAGDDRQRYYNVAARRWQIFLNRGASLCQTAFRAELLQPFEEVIRDTLRRNSYGVDAAFWQQVPVSARSLERTLTVVGIKGLPGRPGLGIGHRPSGPGWTTDESGAVLRQWIGADADRYLALQERVA